MGQGILGIYDGGKRVIEIQEAVGRQEEEKEEVFQDSEIQVALFYYLNIE